MKKLIFSIALPFFAVTLLATEMPSLDFDPPPRKIQVDASRSWDLIQNGRSDVEIVVPPESGDTAMFAGEELRIFLERASGLSIPLATRRGNAKYAIVLGDNALFRKEFPSSPVSDLPRDGFYMMQSGNLLFLAGRDEKSPKIRQFLKTRSGEWRNETYFERGTLFGVYDFLERFAGVRFFFEGEIGTVVPKLKIWKIPGGIHSMDRPDYTVRRVSWHVSNPKEWYDNGDPIAGSNRNYLRWRLQTHSIPNCHGLAYLGYCERFGKTNPEYFALREDGKRYLEKGMMHTGQLCLTNRGIRNEIYLDAASALRGEPASKRGVVLSGYGSSMWASPAYQPGFINIMPQDGFYPCRCPECRNYFDKGDQAASNLIWEMTAEVANRIKAEKIPGYVTQMAYHFYSAVPDVAIPDNVLVMLAVSGPWREQKPMQKADDRKIRDWTEKIRRKIWLWNYCINNAQWGDNYGIPGMPQTTPRTVGNYYKRLKPYIAGAFLECEADHFIWAVPMIYVASKVFWNADSDVDALLDDFYRKMFGDGAPEMKTFFEILEKSWMDNRNEVDTPLGPQTIHLSQFEVWNKIYPPERIRELETLFEKAWKNAAEDPDSRKRIAFFRKHVLDVMKQYFEKHCKLQNSKSELTLSVGKSSVLPALDADFRIPGATAFLRPMKDVSQVVSVKALALSDGKNLTVLFRCDEPEMKQLKVGQSEQDSLDIFKDALFEIFLNPSGDRRNYYQIGVHPSGVFRAAVHPSNQLWKAGISVKTKIGKDFWSGQVTIPLDSLKERNPKGFPFNLSYNRQLQNQKMYAEIYSWSPYIKTSFHEIDHYGNLVFEPTSDSNLLKDWNFDADFSENRLGAWDIPYPAEDTFVGALESDFRTFISGGQSLYMKMDAGKRLDASQNVTLKPDTSYVFSYYLRYRTDPGAAVNVLVSAGQNFFLPELPIRGNAEWHKKEFVFKTPPKEKFNGKAQVRFCIVAPKAEIWIDNVRLFEQK